MIDLFVPIISVKPSKVNYLKSVLLLQNNTQKYDTRLSTNFTLKAAMIPARIFKKNELHPPDQDILREPLII